MLYVQHDRHLFCSGAKVVKLERYHVGDRPELHGWVL